MAEKISPYLERMVLFLKANKVKDDDKVTVLLSVIGGKMYSLLRDLLSPVLPQDATYETLGEALTKHFEPRPIVIAERFHFHRRNQASEESVAEFLAELRCLATHCKFEGYLEQALRDRLVCGLKSENAQKKLLSETDLTLQRAGTTEKNAKSLKHGEPLVHQVSVAGRNSPCHRCGRSNHTANNCT